MGFQLGKLCVFAFVILFGPEATTEAVPVKRSVDFTDPCNVGGVVGGAWGESALVHFDTVVDNLKAGTDGVRQQTIDTKNRISVWIMSSKGAGMVTELNKDDYTFIDSEALGSVYSEELEAITDTSAVLLSHWRHLYNITTMLNYARNDNIIGDSDLDDGSKESILRNKLDSLETSVGTVLCNVHIGLKSQGVTEPIIPEHAVSSTYKMYGEKEKIMHEVYRAYILMKDIDMVMGHLNDVYSTM